MTVYSVMDLSTSNAETANGIETIESSESIVCSHLEDKSGSTTCIATLDVTPEEINICHKCWKHSSEHCSIDNCKYGHDSFEVRRPRSETWPYSFNENSGNIEMSTYHSDYALHKVNILQGAVKFNCDDSIAKSFNVRNVMNGNQSVVLKDKSSFNLDSHKDTTDLSETSVHGKNPIVSDSVNTDNLQLDINEEILSGFTDISLQSTVTDESDNVATPSCSNNVSVNSTKMSGRSSLGSIFGWISSSKEASPPDTVQESQTKNTPNNKSNSDNETVESSSEISNNVQVINNMDIPPVQNSSSTSVGNRNSGIRSIGRSIKTSLSSKAKFWRNHQTEPLSTTALILENRPSNLPSKSEEEAERHRHEYERMVENAKKHEFRDVQKRRKNLKKQLKQEDVIASTSSLWISEILPSWNAMHNTNRTRQLWWLGLPPSVRGKVWQLAIGNELNMTQDLYEIMVTRAHDKIRSMHETQSMGEETESLAADRECTVELIRLDISRTFPHLCIFQKGGPYHDILHDVLGAYACYRPDVGYVQGMSFMAAMLLLNMEPAQAFMTFANLLNKPCQVAFFRLNEELMKTYFATFEVFFEENLPRLFAHFKHHNLTPDIYLIDWIFTMFSKALSLDAASRVWDMFCRDGEDFLFKTAIAILKLHEDDLLQMEFINAAQFLTRLPASSFTHQQLFSHVSDVIMVSRGNRRWKDVLSLMKDVS